MSGCCFIRFESDNSETNKFTPTIVVTDRIFSNFGGREFFAGQSGSELENVPSWIQDEKHIFQ